MRKLVGGSTAAQEALSWDACVPTTPPSHWVRSHFSPLHDRIAAPMKKLSLDAICKIVHFPHSMLQSRSSVPLAESHTASSAPQHLVLISTATSLARHFSHCQQSSKWTNKPMHKERNGFACSDHHPCAETGDSSHRLHRRMSFERPPKLLTGLRGARREYWICLLFTYHVSQHRLSKGASRTLSHERPWQHHDKLGSPEAAAILSSSSSFSLTCESTHIRNVLPFFQSVARDIPKPRIYIPSQGRCRPASANQMTQISMTLRPQIISAASAPTLKVLRSLKSWQGDEKVITWKRPHTRHVRMTIHTTYGHYYNFSARPLTMTRVRITTTPFRWSTLTSITTYFIPISR